LDQPIEGSLSDVGGADLRPNIIPNSRKTYIGNDQVPKVMLEIARDHYA
jgi:hypothetical protein